MTGLQLATIRHLQTMGWRLFEGSDGTYIKVCAVSSIRFDPEDSEDSEERAGVINACCRGFRMRIINLDNGQSVHELFPEKDWTETSSEEINLSPE